MKQGKQSAGLLLYRRRNNTIEYFLVHPGGPFWAKKDEGAWSIPKGEFIDEDPLEAAKREFLEETGSLPDVKNFIELQPVKLKSGKKVYAWAAEGDIEADTIRSNVFPLEWPPKSGKMVQVPEIDKAGWFDKTSALLKINTSQADLVHQLSAIINL